MNSYFKAGIIGAVGLVLSASSGLEGRILSRENSGTGIVTIAQHTSIVKNQDDAFKLYIQGADLLRLDMFGDAAAKLEESTILFNGIEGYLEKRKFYHQDGTKYNETLFHNFDVNYLLGKAYINLAMQAEDNEANKKSYSNNAIYHLTAALEKIQIYRKRVEPENDPSANEIENRITWAYALVATAHYNLRQFEQSANSMLDAIAVAKDNNHIRLFIAPLIDAMSKVHGPSRSKLMDKAMDIFGVDLW